ncbi:MAG: Na+/H+ antiporter subunit E [Endomicrobiia bacterium]|nr:Na+/H+ antiporter subunit E [Endomicrobiia bacterium]
MGNKIIIFFTLFVAWILLTFTFAPSSVLVGALAAALVSLTFKTDWTRNPSKFMQWKRFAMFFKFLAIFALECFKANLDMAMRVLHPKMPLNPAILKVRTKCKTETSITFLSNFITLTPGTFTIDADIESGHLFIHWINAPSSGGEDVCRRVVEKFEKIIIEVFE